VFTEGIAPGTER